MYHSRLEPRLSEAAPTDIGGITCKFTSTKSPFIFHLHKVYVLPAVSAGLNIHVFMSVTSLICFNQRNNWTFFFHTDYKITFSPRAPPLELEPNPESPFGPIGPLSPFSPLSPRSPFSPLAPTAPIKKGKVMNVLRKRPPSEMIYNHLPTFQTINRMFPEPKQGEEGGNNLFWLEKRDLWLWRH